MSAIFRNLHKSIIPAMNKFQRHIISYSGMKRVDHPKVMYMIPVLTTALSIWQIFRHFEKQEMKAKMREESKAIQPDFPDLDNCHKNRYKRYSLVGKFLHDTELLVGPCNPGVCEHPMPDLLKMLFDAHRYFHFYTHFRIKDSKKTIMVDRGYISADSPRINKEMRPETLVDKDDQVITGYLVPMSYLSALNKENLWMDVDYDVYTLRCDETMSFKDGPFGYGALPDIYDMHLPYAGFWFLATIISLYLLRRTKTIQLF
ncbi:SURF1-like protein [Thelohanellus kitauei]|uniref:SURF1-like protein n=1 Tax=Thelohanellus kitauei TaxID=669202 RepID=A0A0C2MJA8_THEKT|nr:SURF1-like protein [Thelohanellus kitauei]